MWPDWIIWVVPTALRRKSSDFESLSFLYQRVPFNRTSGEPWVNPCLLNDSLCSFLHLGQTFPYNSDLWQTVIFDSRSNLLHFLDLYFVPLSFEDFVVINFRHFDSIPLWSRQVTSTRNRNRNRMLKGYHYHEFPEHFEVIPREWWAGNLPEAIYFCKSWWMTKTDFENGSVFGNFDWDFKIICANEKLENVSSSSWLETVIGSRLSSLGKCYQNADLLSLTGTGIYEPP